jgi:molybdopterin synthase catalytic subunit
MTGLTSEKISIDAILAEVEDHSTGAVVLFLGRVRNLSEGRQVQSMDYEAYPEMAEAKLQELEQQVMRRWPIEKIVLIHRVGKLDLGEVSVAIAVASRHRQQAFEVCRYAIDTLKETVPIWKKEYFSDGEGWVKGVVPRTA